MFERVKKCNPNRRNVILRVVDDEYLGEKAFFSNRELVWESEGEKFFSSRIREIPSLEESEIVSIGGHKVFYELLEQGKKLVVCGTGHVAIAVVRIGHMIGCSVTVIDDRLEFAGDARNAGADEVICAPFEEGLKKIDSDRNTYFVIMTRSHSLDQICLEEILKKKYAYIGMIGSERKIAAIKGNILAKGGSKAALDRIHAPIGLDIYAETPEEIAVAVLAEIIREKNCYGQGVEYSREILDGINREGRKVLATVISSKGNFSRAIGARMLVFQDGETIDSVGGGAAEVVVIRKAQDMLEDVTEADEILHLDMTAGRGFDDGMSCDAVLDVYLEMLS
jgi:xanthine dehydrogenase accessory factor